MKKTLALILSLAILPGMSKSIKTPEDFGDYRENCKYSRLYPYANLGIEYVVIEYDMDGDKVADIVEVRRVVDGEIMNPLFYYFDLNRDKEFTEDEIWVDELEDDWNGNEIKYFDYLKKVGV